MPNIIPLPVRQAQPDLDAEARARADRLNRATTIEMQAALGLLLAVDPESFDLAFTVVRADPGDLPDLGEPESICGRCGAPVALFPDQGMTWHHYTGSSDTAGPQQIFNPGRAPEVEWYLPEDIPAFP